MHPNEIQSPQQLTPRERIQRAQSSLNQAVVCPDCGSDWFFEAIFNQYSASRYSSAPGGDLQVISLMPQPMRICLCGRPITPNVGGVRGGRTPNQQMSSFYNALNSAITRQKEVAEGKGAVNAVVNEMATRQEVDDLKAELAELRKLLQSQPAAEAEQPAAEPKKKGGKP